MAFTFVFCFFECINWLVLALLCVSRVERLFCLQIAYRTAGDKFPGKLSELFLVLSDSHVPPKEAQDSQQPSGRGTKHRLDDDAMSVKSVDSKRPDLASSAEKNKASKKDRGNGNKGARNKSRN